MLCECHGEPMYWTKEPRVKAGGRWECKVKRAEYNRTRTTNPERSGRIRTQRHEYWHRANGGYVRDRLRELGAQREQILDRLHQLNQEGELC